MKNIIKNTAITLAIALPVLVMAKKVTGNADGSSFNVHTLTGGSLFIRTSVNQRVSRWVPGDVVHLTQGGRTSVFQYQANGNFSIRSTSSGQATRLRLPPKEAN